MLRSPIFSFIILLLLFSCEKKKIINTNTEFIRKEALSLRNKAIKNQEKQNFNTAFYEFYKSKQLYESLKESGKKDSANIGFILIQMSAIPNLLFIVAM